MTGIRVVLFVVFGVAGWQYARHLTRKYGRRPFGWPDWVWGVVTGVAFLLGLVLFAIAERRLRKTPPATPGLLGVPTYGGAMNVVPSQAGHIVPPPG